MYVDICISVFRCRCTYVYLYICIYIYIYICMNIYIYTNVYIYIYIYTCIHLYIQIYIFIYTYTHTTDSGLGSPSVMSPPFPSPLIISACRALSSALSFECVCVSVCVREQVCVFGKVICGATRRSNIGLERILRISESNLDVDCVVGVRA